MQQAITFIRKTALVLLALIAALAIDARAVTIAWSPVGKPGNAADLDTGFRYGSVGYSYNIGTYDVTTSQYVEFLNVKDPTGANTLKLYSSPSDDINFNSSSLAGNKYSSIAGDENHPVNLVTWYDTLRFANWLNNGGRADSDTESGAYTLLGGTAKPSNASMIVRQAGATIVLPSEDEWYKAAYFNPATDAYYLYPTSSDSRPNATAPTSTPNSANYDSAGGPINEAKPTDVGAYSGTTSPIGAFDMAGNVLQWCEYVNGGLNARLNGAAFDDDGLFLKSTGEQLASPAKSIFAEVGFRLAMIPGGYIVPEPTSLYLAALGLGSFICLGVQQSRSKARRAALQRTVESAA